MFIIIKITNVMRCVLCFYLRYRFDSICLSFCCSYRIIKEICTFINTCRPLCCCTSIRLVITCIACIWLIWCFWCFWCFFIILSLYCVIFTVIPLIAAFILSVRALSESHVVPWNIRLLQYWMLFHALSVFLLSAFLLYDTVFTL